MLVKFQVADLVLAFAPIFNPWKHQKTSYSGLQGNK